jgi:hypothetical protein
LYSLGSINLSSPQAYRLGVKLTKKMVYINQPFVCLPTFAEAAKQSAKGNITQHNPLAFSGQAMSQAVQRPRLLVSSSGKAGS